MSSDEDSSAPSEGAIDMDQLRRMIAKAKPGTGAIAASIAQARFSPGQAAFTSLLQFVSKASQPEKAVEIFESMQQEANIQPNIYSYSSLISALARTGKWRDAEYYFMELKERGKTDLMCAPNAVTYAAMITAYEKGGQFEKALQIFDDQCREGIEPDVITFSSLVNACMRAGHSSKAVEIIDSMHQHGIVGPRNMYNNVIFSCGSEWNRALEIFLGMQCVGVQVTQDSASQLMLSLCAGAQVDRALWLLREATRLQWILRTAAYTSLLLLLGECGNYTEADTCYRRMQETNVWIDEVIAGALVSAHANGGDGTGASYLYSYFVGLGIRPMFKQLAEWFSELRKNNHSSLHKTTKMFYWNEHVRHQQQQRPQLQGATMNITIVPSLE